MKFKYVIGFIIIFSIIFILIFLNKLFIFNNPNLKLLSINNNKKIAGVNSKLPDPDWNNLNLPPQKHPNTKDPIIYAKSSILIDSKSAYILYSKNMDEKLPIASTTKIMTAIVALENYKDNLNDFVKITYPMIAVEGSDIKLQVGEEITIENLLKGLLIMSGNDTAMSIAIHFGPKESFVTQMNDKAKKIGLSSTLFKDPAGLDDTGESSAHDLAILANYAMRNSIFRDIVKTPQTSISSTNGQIVHDLKSSNRLIKPDENLYYPFTIGIKTGFTYLAGHCLISAASKDNHEIIGVVLNTQDNSITASARESKKLLDWGLNNWSWN